MSQFKASRSGAQGSKAGSCRPAAIPTEKPSGYGDQQVEITNPPVCQVVGAIAVAVAQSFLSPLMAVSTQNGGHLQLDQLLHAMAGKFGNQLTGGAASRSNAREEAPESSLNMVRLVVR